MVSSFQCFQNTHKGSVFLRVQLNPRPKQGLKLCRGQKANFLAHICKMPLVPTKERFGFKHIRKRVQILGRRLFIRMNETRPLPKFDQNALLFSSCFFVFFVRRDYLSLHVICQLLHLIARRIGPSVSLLLAKQ